MRYSSLNPTVVDRVTWTYDKVSQLTREHRTGTNAFVVTHSYDAAGNRLVKNDGGSRTTFTYNAANRMVISQASTGRTTYTYNVDGMLRREVAPAGAITTSVWDSDGMPRYIVLPSGGGYVTFTYNGDHRRVKKEPPTTANTRGYVHDGENILSETDGGTTQKSAFTYEPREYGNLVSQLQVTGVVTLWHVFDALGSTDSLVDASEVRTDTYLYEAFGKERTTTGTTANLFSWVGEQGYVRDTETGEYQLRVRQYQPDKARFKSQDPVGVDPDSNLYRYVTNDPLQGVDPSGMDGDEPRPRLGFSKAVLPAEFSPYATTYGAGYFYRYQIGKRHVHSQNCTRPVGPAPGVIERNGLFLTDKTIWAFIDFANSQWRVLTPEDFDDLFDAYGVEAIEDLPPPCPPPPKRGRPQSPQPSPANPGGAANCNTCTGSAQGAQALSDKCFVEVEIPATILERLKTLGVADVSRARIYYDCTGPDADVNQILANLEKRKRIFEKGFMPGLTDGLALGRAGIENGITMALPGGQIVGTVQLIADVAEDPSRAATTATCATVLAIVLHNRVKTALAPDGGAGGGSRKPGKGPKGKAGRSKSSEIAASNPKTGRVDFQHPNFDKALQSARHNAGDLGVGTKKMYDPKTGTLIGEMSADGKRGWRIDNDHVNWWDWTGGKKGEGGKYGHYWFPPGQNGPHSEHIGYAPWE
ncbi:MAG: RHS repeat-associated core domain-containing protein [Planctomycetales bacterium]